MRLIDADKIHPDCMTKDGRYAISQNQLANAPTVERTQGEWIGIDEFPHEDYECNYCGHSLFAVDISEYNFCPNCGARMGGKEE